MTEQPQHTTIEQIKRLAVDGFGTFVPSYLALRSRHPAIRTPDPDACAAEAERRGMPPVNIFVAGTTSVVCWPTVASTAARRTP